MGDQKVIVAATVQVDAGNSNEVIKSLNKSTGELKGSLNEATKSAGAAGKAMGESSGSFGKLKEQIAGVPGPLGQAGEGVGKLNTAFKALLANPIVLILTLIVGALGLLYKAFTNTFEGGEKVEQIFAGIKAVGQSLLDNIDKVITAMLQISKLDFSGAIKTFKGIADEAGNAYTAMAQLTKQAQELKREQATNDLEQAERAKKLAVLREQSTDDSVPIAKRKAALKELRDAAEKDAVADVDLAKRTTDNKISQLTLEKDGAKKNFVEIQELKKSQVQVEADSANELRRINKQVTLADKQENAERKEAQKTATEAAKAERQKLIEYTNKLLKLQQENELTILTDTYAKELKQLENKIADEKRANDVAFKDHKINKEQQAKLNEALDIQLGLQKTALDEKRNKEVQKKEADFQKELSAITSKTRLDGIGDARKNELAQLEIGYQEKLQQAVEHYKDDQNKLQEIKAALDEQLKAAQDKAQAKFKKEDDKKKFDLAEQAQKEIIDKKNFDFDSKFAAVKAEQDLVQKAFDDKIITELEYNSKVAGLADARKTIRDAEAQHSADVAGGIAGGLETLANIAGKQTAVGKVLAIASTTINTYQAAIGAFKGMVTTIPGPVGIALGAVAAAGAIITGLAAVKKIVSVQIPGQGGGGGSAPTGLPTQAAPIAPTQSTTQLGQKSIDDFSNAAKGGVNRSYVVEQDNAAAANRAARLQGASVLGGH